MDRALPCLPSKQGLLFVLLVATASSLRRAEDEPRCPI